MKNVSKCVFVCACVCLLTISPALSASVIDFETVPGTTPSDQLAINTQYAADFGITFGLDTDSDGVADGGTPFLEKTGQADSGSGFKNTNGNYDEADSGYESLLGDYFLRIGTDHLATAPGPALIIDYSTPVSGASGQIWDIDGHSAGTEQWSVTALNTSRQVIDTILSPEGLVVDDTSLDGKPWTWSFDHGLTQDIYAIRLEFVGTSPTVGLAFDNFSPSAPAVPLPHAFWLFGSGLLGMVGIARRNIAA
jgi:hypothetical protein